ncbi:hypothetical protein SAMN05443636_3128 [Halobaculum gomorrense]|uniref:Uncharacterized protein n=1 Tax=Halobaculum gomorrense TaxID=43928 RepID=A0A1M5UTU4_9EURY|nr:hypothetical protein SAMN05443636_3128 [Halobaculum gomorrense]
MAPGHQLQRMQDASEYPAPVVRDVLVLACTRDAAVKIAHEERGHDLESIHPTSVVNALGEHLSRVMCLVDSAKSEDKDKLSTNTARLWAGHDGIAQYIEECEAHVHTSRERDLSWRDSVCEHIYARPGPSFEDEFTCIWDESMTQPRQIMLNSAVDHEVELVDHLWGVAKRQIEASADRVESTLQRFFIWGAYLGPVDRNVAGQGGWANRRVERAADHAKSFLDDRLRDELL